MSDESQFAGHWPQTRTRRPGELLFTLRDAQHRQVDCELRDDGVYGWEAQFWIDREFSYSQRFETRALAEWWANRERAARAAGLYRAQSD